MLIAADSLCCFPYSSIEQFPLAIHFNLFFTLISPTLISLYSNLARILLADQFKTKTLNLNPSLVLSPRLSRCRIKVLETPRALKTPQTPKLLNSLWYPKHLSQRPSQSSEMVPTSLQAFSTSLVLVTSSINYFPLIPPCSALLGFSCWKSRVWDPFLGFLEWYQVFPSLLRRAMWNHNELHCELQCLWRHRGTSLHVLLGGQLRPKWVGVCRFSGLGTSPGKRQTSQWVGVLQSKDPRQGFSE